MKKVLIPVILSCVVTSSVALSSSPLKVVYPPTNHQTSAEKIFFIGTAPPNGQVLVNGKPINRSRSGHFAPSFPLQLGENIFTVRHQNQELQIKVTRLSNQPELPQGLAFAKGSLTPTADIARLPGELICFSAIAPPNASVSVKLGNQTVALLPQPQQAILPSNLAALTGQNQPTTQSIPGKYEGCTTVSVATDLEQPQYQLTLNGKTITQPSAGKITILSPTQLPVAEVVADAGVARTGPSTDFSRLTPLPKGTRATVTGKEGEWFRLEYGAWINSQETRILPGSVPPRTVIRSVGYRRLPGTTEMLFPLQTPVPVSVQQGEKTFTLTLYNTTAQTDIIRLDDDPLISRLDWQQIASGEVKYTFNLKKAQQWGYKLRYDGTTLVLALRHAPVIRQNRQKPLSGIKILLDPGHGGKESGATGPTGYLEKDVNLAVSKLLRDELLKLGANVVMTRDDDRDVSLPERQAIINREEPAIALSVHYNSLPDNGDAENTKGVGTFWYNAQAHSLAVFMHNYLVNKLRRPSYGVFWNNLALTRPAAAPSVLLELGFMSNPDEFEWVTNPQEQKKLAEVLAEGITEWFRSVKS
ncbi:Cell wall hydrolase/autolysin [Trichormus variabilis ATCC 29413]|uniref:Cell wall hydrolase/autolysin n=2 Tax=Anabaena variabilis TaxID=264691 RepID=Q3MAV0_TRIV2|nr:MULTISPECIES: N-acetylmuramoyl-L-alanine amidase [Nostocaceae]ABA21886.1 Cell wall hydrolase/autolysin [Trichormus variabilis ATCC 29413]MBC1213417.1 N-acetylmuramoyl-L-alanine amidase [Trichormus variabilis ARAD]MBC1254424.1 N-acetylmuramoyl-L-alanine amidase [Trichormus variabilis V5]MBC1267879.1 N-acetylmuramoyl-L-alanine amidase [Trichormus variabilis FSR]MBC1302409.1 N-acetylmuramoyl-L-alanine amidase [Trichormus variabilis N2B]